MRVGIPTETKNNEFRVAITPAGVAELTRRGHEVLIQAGAGEGSAITDADFKAAGAQLVGTADQVWADADLLLKVKEPIAAEYGRLRHGQILFTFLHLAASRACTDALLDSGTTSIAYETVQTADGALPLLAPMSEVAGRLAAQVGAYHLMRTQGGRGVLMGLSDWELAAARAAIARGLDEDLRYGPDVTTLATVPASATTTASLVTREAGVVAGLDVALLTLNEVLGTNGYRVLDRVEDGARVPPGEALMTLEAQTRGLLTAERTMLNLVGHLSGIATATAAWVDAVRGTKAKIRDTRKTLPGLRALQKYAVRTGGGVNHRLGLGDAALIKDNHVAAAGSVVDALRAVRNAAPDLPCEVEVDSLEQLDAVLPEKPELILLDNFAVWQTQTAVQRRDSRAPTVMLESSGGLSLQTAATYAETGVDYLAVGALTHSVRVLDIGLDM